MTPARPPSAPGVQARRRPRPPLANARVLVVSHDAAARAEIAQTLLPSGYELIETGDGKAAPELARAHACHAVLVDGELRDPGARRVCRSLKADADVASVPVLFVTRPAARARPAPGLMLDADDHVSRPIAPMDLLLRLRLRIALGGVEPEPVRSVPLLDYHAFVHAADEQLARSAASLVLLSVHPESLEDGAQAVFETLEPHDLLARRGAEHLLMLLPETAPATITRRLTRLTSGVIEAVPGRVHAGVAIARRAGVLTPALLAEADQALADARTHDLPFSRALRQGDDMRPPTRTVLVADDDPYVAEIAAIALRDGGYRPVLVGNGQAALRAVLADKPDVLVLDLGMQGLSGFDVLRRLRDVSPAQRPRLLVLSADGEPADLERAFALGAADYIVKPVDPQDLVARVTRLV